MGLSATAPWRAYCGSTPVSLNYPNLTMYQLLHKNAKQYPNNTAYVFMGKQTTYAAFMNRIGLTTLIPREIEIISNQYRKVLPDGCHVTAKKPVVQINTENYEYLQLLDAIENLSVIHVDADNPDDLIRAAAKERKTKPIDLIFYARQFYPVKTLLRTVDIFAGVNK